jgi:hypothetical protein
MAAVPPAKAARLTLDEWLSNSLNGRQRRHAQNWSQTNIDQGQINGLTFDRTSWSGKADHFGVPARGFIYVAIDGSNYIEISGQDVEPNHETTLKLGEAAALTFHK